MAIHSALLLLSLLTSLYLLITSLTLATIISYFLEVGSDPSFDMRVDPTIKPAGLGACLDFRIATNWVGCFVNDFLGTEIHLTYIDHDFFPQQCFPHGLWWTCLCREAQHMWKHSEEQEWLTATNSALKSLVLAYTLAPGWHLPNNHTISILLDKHLNTSGRAAACHVICLHFSACIKGVLVCWVPELPLQPAQFGQRFNWSSAARQQGVCSDS